MRLARGMGALDQLFAHVADFARQQGLDADRERTLALVAEELFTNLIRHNRGGRDHVLCDLRRDGPRAVLRFADLDVERSAWPGEGPDEAPGGAVPGAAPGEAARAASRGGPTVAPPALDGEGGLGVHIVRRLTENLAYNWADGVLTVTAVVNLEGEDVHHREV